MSAAATPQRETPVISVTRGNPAPAELAAVLAVLLAAWSADPAPPAAGPARDTQWAKPARVLATLPRPCPGSWRASALPR